MKQNKQLLGKNGSVGTINKPQPQSTIITTIQQRKPEAQSTVKLSPYDLIAKHVIKDILTLVNKITQQNHLINTHLSNFSSNSIQSYINENIDIYLSVRKQEKPITQQQQPDNIKGDNLCPASTSVEQKSINIDEVASLPQSLGRMTRNMSTLSRLSRNTNNNIARNNVQNNNKKAPKVYEYIKLNEKDLPQTQVSLNNDPYVQELRRLKQAKPKILQKKQQDKKPNLRQRIKLQDKFSYDFTGEILNIKQQQKQKSTLLTAQIKTVQNEGQTTRPYESMIQNTPTNLENPNLKKDKTKKLPSSRQPEVEFSNVMSLVQHLEINQGARFIHNKATVQKKKKQPSINDIKKSLSLNKISRSQFARLKSIDNEDKKRNLLLLKSSISPSLPSLHNNNNNNQSIFEQEDNNTLTNRQNTNIYSTIQSDRIQIRSLPKYTQLKKNNKILLTQRTCQRVSVENQQLSEMLVDGRFDVKINQGINVKRDQQNQQSKHDTNLQALSPRDIANLHYIKTGGTIGKLELPKIISHLHNPSKKQKLSNSILQSKSNIKGKRNQNEIQRLKKHFQEKLRV